MHIVEALQSEK